MNNNLLQIKVAQRLNKLGSDDYDNIECWQIQEAFNKAQIEFCRRQIFGNNQRNEGDESTKMIIDDMQRLLTESPIALSSAETYYESTSELPDNYLYFKRVNADSVSECCPNRPMRVHLEEDADVDELLADELSKPSMMWGETFCVLKSNRIRVFTNGEFAINNAKLSYYRKPVDIEILDCVNPVDDTVYTADVECEFKDDIAELIIDETVAILAGDIELFNNYQRSKQQAAGNN